ncbi:Ig-like domain-containing protein, partial [Frigoribacterium sp. RIT-PI-h]|uniref:Ig-like domain-containing protein n=1 Tax=Frigoribacterium sp. RIT-PI-h TaxID=1690245 RepID=UPI0006CD41C1
MHSLTLAGSPRRGRRALRLSAALLATLALAGTAALTGTAAPARAAEIDGAITDVTVTPTTPKQGTQLTTTIAWQVPDDTMAGDTFTLTLSEHLKNLPTDFALRDPATGAVVADATVVGTRPYVITFTMTAYAEDHLNVSGQAFVTSDFEGRTTPSGVPTPFTSTTNDGRDFTTVVTPTGVMRGLDQPTKYGTYTAADQGRSTAARFLTWHVLTPLGAFDSATTTDVVPAGQAWTYDCDTAVFDSVRVKADGSFAAPVTVTPTSFSCSPAGFTVNWGAQVVNVQDRVNIAVSLPAPTGTATPAQTFTNRATVSTVVGGVTTTGAVSSSKTQAPAGGEGSGDVPAPAVTITKGDAAGNAADTAAAAVVLSDGTASLAYRVTNTGADALADVTVSDEVLANGTVDGLSCDFAPLGGPATGVTWAGPFAVGASFDRTAALTGVTAGDVDHHDVGTVTARGIESGEAVSASNAWFARVAAAAGTPTTPSASPTTNPAALAAPVAGPPPPAPPAPPLPPPPPPAPAPAHPAPLPPAA